MTAGIGGGLGLLAGAVVIAIGMISLLREDRSISQRMRIAIGMIFAALIGIALLILLRMSDTGL